MHLKHVRVAMFFLMVVTMNVVVFVDVLFPEFVTPLSVYILAGAVLALLSTQWTLGGLVTADEPRSETSVAQTGEETKRKSGVDRAHERYVTEDDYTIHDLERDLDRALEREIEAEYDDDS